MQVGITSCFCNIMSYPASPLEFPSPFNGNGQRMLHARIAIWSFLKSDYQMYDVNRDVWPILRLNPCNSGRTRPYYFAEGTGDNHSRSITVYRPRARIHSHADMAIWHTGGWLCRKNTEGGLDAIIPLLAVSDPAKLQWIGNVGIHSQCDEFRNWIDLQTLAFYRPIIHNRIQSRSSRWESDEVTDTAVPTLDPIPLFVAETLLEKAIAAEEMCPISIEPFTKGSTIVTSCFHIFQKEALDEWRTKHVSCPLCKKTCAITIC